jgi:hypothetical protein
MNKQDLKENLYDTIQGGDVLSFNINGFKVNAVNMIRASYDFVLRLGVYKDDVLLFGKEYEIDVKRIKNRFFKRALIDFDKGVIDTIIEDLTPILAKPE